MRSAALQDRAVLHSVGVHVHAEVFHDQSFVRGDPADAEQ